MKKNDLVYYMSGNEMKSGNIKGVSMHEGSVWNGSSKIDAKDGPIVIYTIGDYDTIESGKVFASSDELIKSLLEGLNSTTFN